MARSKRDAKINSRTARALLSTRTEPYWTVISRGCAIGYRRGDQRGNWIVRFRDEVGRQHYSSVGAADDLRDPDGVTALSFDQAQEKAREFFARKAREMLGGIAPTAERYTVTEAVQDYFDTYVRRGGKAIGRMNSAARTHILPNLGPIVIAKLSRHKIELWLESIVAMRARVRVAKGKTIKFKTETGTEDEKRRRRATANRVLTILKAALNCARHAGKVVGDEAWASVKAFRSVDASRLRYLSDDETRKIVNGCDPNFRALVVAAIMTGCRYGELVALTVDDFNANVGSVHIKISKNGKPRHVTLSEEGQRFFARQCIGKDTGGLLFTKFDDGVWKSSNQQRRLAMACIAAGVSPITFHGLRHTYASRLVMKGVPLQVIAAQLGHSDTRMVEKHYGHLAPSYIADTVRAAFSPLGITPDDNVTPITRPNQAA